VEFLQYSNIFIEKYLILCIIARYIKNKYLEVFKMNSNLDQNWSAVFLDAARNRDIANVVAAMVMGADMSVKCPETGNTALHFAAYHRSPELYDFIAGPQDRFENDIQAILSESEFKDVLPDTIDAVANWKAAIGKVPIAVQNNHGLLPSSCIPEIHLNPRNAFEGLMKDFWWATINRENAAIKSSPDGFINLLCSNSYGMPFPNIVR
jgi:hypothetical protein